MFDALVMAWNARNGTAVAMSYTPTGIRWEYALPGARLEGRAAIAGHVQAYMDAVPDCTLQMRSVGETPDCCMVLEWTFRGTHQRDLPGLPAQGEEIGLDGVSVCEMDGPLIRVERVYWDAATLLAGAGVLGARELE